MLIMTVIHMIFMAAVGAQNLQSTFERTYNGWRNAMVLKNFSKWKQVTAPHRQMLARNAVVSSRGSFPDGIFKIPIVPPAITQMRTLGSRVEGDTGVAIYYGRVDYGVSSSRDIPNNLLVLAFVKDKGTWKFDTTRLVNLAATPEVRREIEVNNLQFLESPEFQPSGEVPPMMKPCEAPDFVGHIAIVSIGYQTRAIVNSTSPHDVHNDVISGVIVGGLKRGKNRLDLRMKVDPRVSEENRKFEVLVYAKTGNRRKPQARIFRYAPEKVPATHVADVFANAVTMDSR